MSLDMLMLGPEEEWKKSAKKELSTRKRKRMNSSDSMNSSGE
jgi:hypothetical protein